MENNRIEVRSNENINAMLIELVRAKGVSASEIIRQSIVSEYINYLDSKD